MVKWYNGSLPRISRGFDYPWPHRYRKAPARVHFLSVREEKGAFAPYVAIETAGSMLDGVIVSTAFET
jgi:hypothetical protein